LRRQYAPIWHGGSSIYYHSSEDASDALANNPYRPSGVTYDCDFATKVVKATVATLALRAVPAAPVDPNVHLAEVHAELLGERKGP